MRGVGLTVMIDNGYTSKTRVTRGVADLVVGLESLEAKWATWLQVEQKGSPWNGRLAARFTAVGMMKQTLFYSSVVAGRSQTPKLELDNASKRGLQLELQ